MGINDYVTSSNLEDAIQPFEANGNRSKTWTEANYRTLLVLRPKSGQYLPGDNAVPYSTKSTDYGGSAMAASTRMRMSQPLTKIVPLTIHLEQLL